MGAQTVDAFVNKMKEKLGAEECVSFSSVGESVDALFEAFQLGPRDCVYVSALAPCRTIRAILARGAVPMLCDVTPDSLTIDHRALEAAVRHTLESENLYPRAVIADHFCGMPFAVKPLKAVCDRVGLVFIENCGEWFGGTSDGVLCGTSGDYALFSVGGSSVFGTGGSGALAVSFGDSPLAEGLICCDGEEIGGIDPIYGDALLVALDRTDDVLAQSRAAAAAIDNALAGSDFWLQRAVNSRQKSSFGGLAVIAQSEEHAGRAIAFLREAGLGAYVSALHVHRRACFPKHCKGFQVIENASALAPRAFRLDIFGALHAGVKNALLQGVGQMANDIRE